MNTVDSEANLYGTSDRWFVLFLVAGNYFTLYLHRNLINYLQTSIQADLNLSQTQLGWLHASFLLAYALSQIFVGYLGDRFRRRSVLLVSLALSTLILGGMGAADSFAQLFVLRLCLAVAQSASVPAIAGIMADCFTSLNRSRAVGIYLLSSPFSVIAAGWLGGRLGDLYGWRTAMFSFAAFGAATWLILWLLLREPPRTERRHDVGLGEQGGAWLRTLRTVLSTPSFLLLALAYVIVANVAQLTLYWLPPYFHELFAMNQEQAGRMATVWIQSGTVAGLFLGGAWADVWARRWIQGRFAVQLIGLLICIPTLGVVGFSHSHTLLAVAMLFFGLGNWLYLSNLWTTTFEVVDPAARSTAIGLLNVSAGLVGGWWISPLVGYLRDTGGVVSLGTVFLGAAIGLIVPAVLIGVIMAFLLARDFRGRPPDASPTR